MKTCKLSDFIQALKPWINDDYVQKAFLDENGHFVLLFVDGVKDVYQIEDCEKSQIEAILEDMKKKGVSVEFPL